MPIVTAYCRVKDGDGKEIDQPQVFLKVRGKMYRTHIWLDDISCYPSGWTGYRNLYHGYMSDGKKEELKKLAQAFLDTDQSVFAVDPRGLTHCGIKFVF